jgi:hypothetical protein
MALDEQQAKQLRYKIKRSLGAAVRKLRDTERPWGKRKARKFQRWRFSRYQKMAKDSKVPLHRLLLLARRILSAGLGKFRGMAWRDFSEIKLPQLVSSVKADGLVPSFLPEEEEINDSEDESQSSPSSTSREEHGGCEDSMSGESDSE